MKWKLEDVLTVYQRREAVTYKVHLAEIHGDTITRALHPTVKGQAHNQSFWYAQFYALSSYTG